MSYLDLLIDISNGDLVCSIFDKREAFDFHIVNFPHLYGSIPTAPAYNYHKMSSRHFSARKLVRTLYKCMGRYPELASSKFNKSPSSKTCDSVLMAQSYHTFPQLMK